MNIFDVLSQGKSRLHEPAISAMLGYMLGTHRDHGLGDSFLRLFLRLLRGQTSAVALDSVLQRTFVDTAVTLEEPYQLGNSRKDIDIQISVLNRDREEDIRIIVENKIKVSAGNPKQLVEYYQAVLEDDAEIRNLILVFLTPASGSDLLRREYDAVTPREGHQKAWLHWNAQEGSVLGIIQSILEMEMRGEITPINEYIRHTLKAFALHIRSVVGGESPRKPVDIGEIVDEVYVQLKGGQEYRIVRRDSQQIQVFSDDEKVMAKAVLREVIQEKGLDVPLTGINTRQMGKQVLDALKFPAQPHST
jgi:hypothetical protein